MKELIKSLLNKGGPRLHAFVTWLASITLALCCIIIAVAIVFTSKNLSAEFGTIVFALSGLAGYSYKTGKGTSED